MDNNKKTFRIFRPSSMTRVYKILELLSNSNSISRHELIAVGSTHVSSKEFGIACKICNANILKQSRKTSSLWINIIPLPKPINFVVTIPNHKDILQFVKLVEYFLICNLCFVSKSAFDEAVYSVLDAKCSINSKLKVSSDFFVYGFDFDYQDPERLADVGEMIYGNFVPENLQFFFQ